MAKTRSRVEQTRAEFNKAVDDAGGKTACALRLGSSLSMINQVCSGERNPGLELAYRIELMFKIPMQSWLDAQHLETVKRFA